MHLTVNFLQLLFRNRRHKAKYMVFPCRNQDINAKSSLLDNYWVQLRNE
jgi:hypothetical protein